MSYLKIIHPILQFVPKGGFIHQLFTLMTGTAIAQGITFLAMLVLTRLYTPEEFGVFALYGTIVSLSAPLMSGRYELAIVPAESDDEAAGILVLCCAIALCVGLLSAFFILCGVNGIATYIGMQSLVPYLRMIPLTIVMAGLYRAFQYFCIRRQQYLKISSAQVLQSGLSVSVQLGCGQLAFGIWGLVMGQLVGIIAASSVLYNGSRKAVFSWYRGNRAKIFASLSEIAVRHRKHPIYLPWGGLINVLGQKLPMLLLSVYYGPHFLGLYVVAESLVKAPVSLLSQASSQILFKKMTQEKIKKRMDKFIMKWALIATGLLIVPFLILYLYGGLVFSFVFGSTWEKSGELSAFLIPYFWGALVVSPLSTLLIIAHRQGLLVFMQTLFLLAGFGALHFGHQVFENEKDTILLYSLSQWSVYLVYFTVLFHVGKGLIPPKKW